MIIAKLGGSIITNKQRPLSARPGRIAGIARALSRIREPLIIVHGGGSFGHYWSVKYDMHTKPARYDARGLCTVKQSMIELDRTILNIMMRCKMHPYTMPPEGFVRAGKAIPSRIDDMASISRAGLVPLTYGDALWYGSGKSYILSGDHIMGMLARRLRPRLCMFVTDVDGLYTDMRSKRLIPEMRGHKPQIGTVPADVTGGMQRKVKEAVKIAKMGLDVFFVNGNRPERITGAARGKFAGTVFRGR